MTNHPEITLAGQTYRLGKMPAMQQFHVSRKIAALVPALAPAFLAFKAADGAQSLEDLLPKFQPFADALATMDDKAADDVVGACLASVNRLQGGVWAPVWIASAQTLAFDDMDVSQLMPLVIRSIAFNLGPFIQGLLIGQIATEQPAT